MVDGAWKEGKKREPGKAAAYGWVLIESGKISAKGKEIFFTDSPNQVETYALFYGIIKAQKRGHQSLEIWLDTKNIVEACRNSSKSEISVRNIILDIIFLLGKFTSIILIHVPIIKVNREPSSLLSNCSKERVKVVFYVALTVVKKKSSLLLLSKVASIFKLIIIF